MTLADKIKLLMKKSGIRSLYKFHQMLVQEFGKEALSRRSLTTIMNQKVVIRTKTIEQLSKILNVTPTDFIKDTDIQTDSKDLGIM